MADGRLIRAGPVPAPPPAASATPGPPAPVPLACNCCNPLWSSCLFSRPAGPPTPLPVFAMNAFLSQNIAEDRGRTPPGTTTHGLQASRQRRQALSKTTVISSNHLANDSAQGPVVPKMKGWQSRLTSIEGVQRVQPCLLRFQCWLQPHSTRSSHLRTRALGQSLYYVKVCI